MTRARNLVVGAFAALTLFTGFDHAMRVDQASMCARGDAVTCPDKLWWFMPAAETDGELMALTGVHPLESRLVGYGCEGADGPIYRNQEDEFPACERIEPR